MPELETADLDKFESETLEPEGIEELISNLRSYLKKLSREQSELLIDKLSTIEERCGTEIRDSLEHHLKVLLERNFQKVLQSSHDNFSKMFAPLLQRAEEDIKLLNQQVTKTNTLCQSIQEKYALKWGKPFFLLILATSLTGAFMGISLMLMQTTPLALFLMDEKNREMHKLGEYWMAAKEKRRGDIKSHK